MKKVLSVLFIAIILSTLCIPAVFASSSSPGVVDMANLLTDDEEAALTSKLDEIRTRQDFDIVVVTTNTIDGKTPMEYADDYYDYNGYSDNGCLLLVSMEDRDWWISTKGYGITALTDYGIDYIGDEITSYLSDAEYADAFDKYAQLVDEFVTKARNGTPYDTNHKPVAMEDILIRIGISLFIGLVIAIIVLLALRSKYKPVRLKSEANDYLVQGSLVLRQSYDHFLYTHTTRERRSDSSSSGGGSSTHTSSSGSTHGGGGGKF